jgi:hypothetical protein
MSTATLELDRRAHTHPVDGCVVPSRPRASAGAGTARRRTPARRPVPPATAGARAATRAPERARLGWRSGLALLAIAVVAVLLITGGGGAAAGLTSPVGPVDQDGAWPSGAAHVVVGPGETVWGLVAAHAPAGVDLAVYVDSVLEHNGLQGSTVRAGTVVRLP